MTTRVETDVLNERQPPRFYFDVLALAVGKTRRLTFTSDPVAWNRVIHDFKEETKQKAPELLSRIHFYTSRPPLPPLSEEVDQFLSTMRMSGLLFWVHDYSQLRTTAAVKRVIVDIYSPELRGWEDLIEELARQIDEKLAKHPPQRRE